METDNQPTVETTPNEGATPAMGGDDHIQTLYNSLKKINPNIPDFDKFKTDMKDENNLKTLHASLSKRNPDFPDFEKFKTDMVGGAQPQREDHKAVMDKLASPPKEPDHKDAYSFYSQYQQEKADKQAVPSQPEKIQAEETKKLSSTSPREQLYLDRLSKNPKDTKAANDLGAIYLSEGKKLEASNTFLNAIENNPHDAASRVGYSHILNQDGDYKKSIDNLNTAIQLSPQNSMAWSERAYAKSKSGDKEGALKDASMAEQLDPENNYHNDLKASIYKQQGNNESATQEYLKSDQKKDNADNALQNGVQKFAQGDKNTPFGLPDNTTLDLNSTPQEKEYNDKVRNQIKFVDWLESGGVKGSDDYASKVLGYFMNPIGAIAAGGEEQVGKGLDDIKNADGTLKVLNGLLNVGFGAVVSTTPEGIVYNATLGNAPPAIQEALMHPLSTLYHPTSETGKGIAQLGDVFAQILTVGAAMKGSKGLYDAATKAMKGETLSPTEAQTMQQGIKDISQDDIQNTQAVINALPKEADAGAVKKVVAMTADMMQARKAVETANPLVKPILEETAKTKEQTVRDEIKNQINKLNPKEDATETQPNPPVDEQGLHNKGGDLPVTDGGEKKEEVGVSSPAAPEKVERPKKETNPDGYLKAQEIATDHGYEGNPDKMLNSIKKATGEDFGTVQQALESDNEDVKTFLENKKGDGGVSSPVEGGKDLGLSSSRATPTEAPKGETQNNKQERFKQELISRGLPEGASESNAKSLLKSLDDAKTAKEILHLGNKNLRAVWSKETGVELPKTVKGTHEAIDKYFAEKNQSPLVVSMKEALKLYDNDPIKLANADWGDLYDKIPEADDETAKEVIRLTQETLNEKGIDWKTGKLSVEGQRSKLFDKYTEASNKLDAFTKGKRGEGGLIDDATRKSDKYLKLYDEYKTALKEYQDFNQKYKPKREGYNVKKESEAAKKETTDKPSLSEIKSKVIEKAPEAKASAKKEGVSLKVQKEDLLGQIDKARNAIKDLVVEGVSTPEDVLADKLKKDGFEVSKHETTGETQVVFDVEGDGTFKLNAKGLDTAYDEVKKHWKIDEKPAEIKIKGAGKPNSDFSTGTLEDAEHNLAEAKKSGNKKLIDVYTKELELTKRDYKVFSDKQKAKSQIAEGVTNAVGKLSNKKNLLPEEQTKLYDDIKNIVEGVVKLGGITIKEAVSHAIESIKNSDWYKAMTDADKADVDKITDDLGEQFKEKEEPVSETSTKNAVINAERLKEGKAPVTKIKSIDLDAIREKVKEHLNNPDTYRSSDKNVNPHVLAQWSMEHPNEPISAWQEALLGGERDKLHVEREEAHRLSEEGKQEGDMAKFLANKDLALEKQNLIDISDAANSYRGTEWSNIGRQRQQMIKNDYSIDSILKKYQIANNFDEIPADVEKKLRDAGDRIKELENQLNELQSKKEGIVEEGRQTERRQNIKEAATEISKLIRKGKTTRPGIFQSASPASLVWNGALEAVAKVVDAGGSVAQAIANGLEHIKNSDWYKGLSNNDQQTAEKGYKDFFDNKAKKIKAVEKRLQTRLENLTRQNEIGEYVKKEKKASLTSPEIERLKNRIADQKKIADRIIQDRYLQDRVWFKKLFDFLKDYQHLGVITSLKAVAKIATNIPVQLGRNTVADAFSAALGVVPQLRNTPTFKGNVEANMRSIAKRWSTITGKDVWKDSINAFLGKTTEIDRLAGVDKEDKSPYWKKQFDVLRKVLFSAGVGIHKGLKSPVMKAEYDATLTKWNIQSLMSGEDITDPLVMERNKEMALQKALSVAFMQDNAVVKKWRLALSKAGENTKQGASFPLEAGKFVAETINPVVKLPSNYARDMFELEFGLVQALGQSLHQILPEHFAGKGEGGGWDKMTPYDKNLLVKRILKGSAGVALSAWGWYNYESFGGYYNPHPKQEPDVPLGAIKIGNEVIGEHIVTKLLLHNPLYVIPQLAATARRVTEARHKASTDVGSMALGKAAAGALSEVPFLENTSRTVQAVSTSPKKAAENYGSSFIPAIIRNAYGWIFGDKKESVTATPPAGGKKSTNIGTPKVGQAKVGEVKPSPVMQIRNTKKNENSN